MEKEKEEEEEEEVEACVSRDGRCGDWRWRSTAAGY